MPITHREGLVQEHEPVKGEGKGNPRPFVVPRVSKPSEPNRFLRVNPLIQFWQGLAVLIGLFVVPNQPGA